MVEHLRPQLDVALPAAAVELERVEAEGQRRVDVAGVARQLGAAVVVPLRAAVARRRAAIAIVSICLRVGFTASARDCAGKSARSLLHQPEVKLSEWASRFIAAKSGKISVSTTGAPLGVW